MSTATQTNIDSILTENRVFECSDAFRSQAHIRGMEDYERLYKEAETDPETFWGEIASQLHWFKPWDQRARLGLPLVQVVLRRRDSTSVITASTAMSRVTAATKPPSSGKASRAK